MLFLLIYLFSIYYSITHRSLAYWATFQFLTIVIIGLYFTSGIDVAYKVNLSLASDTKLYYQGYTSSWENLGNNLFYHYPLILRLLTFPWVNSLFATWGQSTLIYLLLDIIVKSKQNLLLFISLHALIYTSTNLFKDNLILLIGLFGYIILDKSKNSIWQCAIIFLLISIMSWIRPFLKFALPLSLYPLFLHINSIKIKNTILLLLVISFVLILYSQREFIHGVMNSFADDAALAEGRSSVPVAIVKIIFGPTPFHYIFAQKYFSQPFLHTHTYIFGILHYLFYLILCFFIVHLFYNYKRILNIYKASVARLFVLLIAVVQLFVYVIIYGSADIRQRGVILTFTFLYCIVDQESIFKRRFKKSQFVLLLASLCFVNIITIIS